MTTLTAPANSAPAPSLNGTADSGPLRAAHTPNFPTLLRQLGASLLVTTYQAGKLVMVRDEGDHLNTHYRAFPSPMGLALADGIFVGERPQDVFLVSPDGMDCGTARCPSVAAASSRCHAHATSRLIVGACGCKKLFGPEGHLTANAVGLAMAASRNRRPVGRAREPRRLWAPSGTRPRGS
jgi:Domain of unknown function (DUF4915)